MKKKQVHQPYEQKDDNGAGKIIEDNASVKEEKNKYDYAYYVKKHNEMLRKTSSTNVSGFPIPTHNFPTPLEPHERDYDDHQFIDTLNRTIATLNCIRVNLFDDMNDELPDIHALSNLKLLIQNEAMPKFLRELRGVALFQSDIRDQTLYPDTRDKLVNIGAGMFTCGLFLIMMGSKTGNGAEATAANYHLEKGIYQKNRGSCQTCGHTNCDPAKGCDANLGDSRWL